MSTQPSSSTVNSASASSVKNPKAMNYRAVVQKDLFPTKYQGLILDCMEGLTLTDYTVAIGDIVKPSNILFASKISNNRICLHLKSKELVEDITEKYEYVEIGEHKVSIRPLVSKQRRIIISNVAPTIPHYILEEKLNGHGIKRCAPISILKATIGKGGYEHILSHRRQTYIDPEDIKKLPEFIKIEYEETPYYVYPSIGVIKCSLCGMEGHIAKHCPTSENALPTQEFSNESYTNLDNNEPYAAVINTPIANDCEHALNLNSDHSQVNLESSTVSVNTTRGDTQQTKLIELMPPPSTKNKRAVSTSSCASSVLNTNFESRAQEKYKIKHTDKKPK